MTDFIEREAAKRAIFEQSHFMTLAEETHGGYGTVLWGKDIVQEETAMNALNAIPAADMVKVVRCKDCRWALSNERNAVCMRKRIYFSHELNYFCADGERREVQDDD